MGGMRKTQSVITAAMMSPAPAPGRLARYTPRQPVCAGHRGQRRVVDEVDGAGRDEEQPRLVPVRPDQQRNTARPARGEPVERRGGQDRTVDGGREWQQAPPDLPPPAPAGGAPRPSTPP